MNKNIIFIDDNDRNYYLKLVWKYAGECEISVHAYCLMSNHVHFLLKAEMKNISDFMHNLGLKYALYFNSKYDRIGHLFQNRYDSFSIDTEAYYLCCIRYIHQNPEKAHICPAERYPWSSYSSYINRRGPVVWEQGWAILISEENLHQFMNQTDHEKYPFQTKEDRQYTDEEAVELIKNLLGIDHPELLKTYECDLRDTTLKAIYRKGVSVVQISKVTGISTAVIYRAIKEK